MKLIVEMKRILRTANRSTIFPAHNAQDPAEATHENSPSQEKINQEPTNNGKARHSGRGIIRKKRKKPAYRRRALSKSTARPSTAGVYLNLDTRQPSKQFFTQPILRELPPIPLNATEADNREREKTPPSGYRWGFQNFRSDSW